MKTPVMILLLAALALPVFAGTAPAPYVDSVVSLNVTFQTYNEDRPWNKRTPQTRNAYAAVIEGPFLLTTAQMIADATLIEVEKHGLPLRTEARVILADPEADLALLQVDAPDFFKDLRPVRFAKKLPKEGAVTTARWKDGQLETWVSRTTRLQVRESFFGSLNHLFLMVLTDLPNGGWSEPVFFQGEFLGLTANQTKQETNVIPCEFIEAFLRSTRDPGGYRPFAAFGIHWQVNEDPALAAFLGLEGPLRGIVVREIPWGSSGCGVLQPRDILLSLDGKPIDPSGNYVHPDYGRIDFTDILTRGFRAGDHVPVEVLRQGQILRLIMPLSSFPAEVHLIPWRRYADPPPFLIAGGLIFRELDGPYLRTWGDEWQKKAPATLVTMNHLLEQAQEPERRRIVLLQGVIPDDFTLGYQNLEDLAVDKVNGQKVDSLQGVEAALRQPVSGFHIIEFLPFQQLRQVVLDASGLEEATTRIMADYQIPLRKRLRDKPLPDPGPACK